MEAKIDASLWIQARFKDSDLSWSPTGVTVRVAASPSVLVSEPISNTGVCGTGSMSNRSSWASVHSDRVKEGWRLTD